MSAILDLFADFEPAAAPPTVPVAAAAAIVAPAPPPVAPAASSWAYKPLRGVPAHLIGRACLCGALDERPGPSLDNIACWSCHQPNGMRPTPWRPTTADLKRGVMR